MGEKFHYTRAWFVVYKKGSKSKPEVISTMERKYLYRGDRLTDKKFKNKECSAVLRPDGKCIRGRNGNMYVSFGHLKVVVLARQLRRIY
jgi:hypothetical protein